MEETKQKRFEIRLSDEEKQNIEEKAKLSGLTMSEYIRQAAVTTSVKINIINEPNVNQIADLAFQIKKVGTNINQIAHKLNSNGVRFGSCLFRVSVDCSQTMSICIRMRCSIIVISCSVSFVHVDSRP